MLAKKDPTDFPSFEIKPTIGKKKPVKYSDFQKNIEMKKNYKYSNYAAKSELVTNTLFEQKTKSDLITNSPWEMKQNRKEASKRATQKKE
jgi:hypothetical protein